MTGIDHYIQDALTRFDNKLWTDKSRNFNGLARIDIEENIPYIRNGYEYEDVLFDDRFDATLFFYEPDTRSIEGYTFTTQVNIVFQLKFHLFTETEEEIMRQAYDILKKTAFTTDGIAKDVAALDDFDYRNRIPDTMSPWFIFRFDNTLNGTLANE